jgi:D-alanyl-D-alanine carboxypeptidase
MRGIFVLIAFMAMFSASVVPAAAVAQKNLRSYAGIVVDAKSGKVLYEDHADSTRYPASITKVMTLYVLFQELAAGNIKLSTKMRVSKYAASAVPTKLGLKAGSTIRVDDAIKSLVTISANDMARVVAETVSGSESRFAERMTATAQALGMTHTRYANASGLPDGSQVTTVRDQAILAIAIYQHFPQYYKFFQTRSFKFGKRTYNSHVPLFGVAGVEGLKTGYINNSGYNLMTVTRKDNKHLVIIGFGFNSTKERNTKVASQLSKYLSKAQSGDYVQTAMIPVPTAKGPAAIAVASLNAPVMPMPYPDFRDDDDAEAVIAASDQGEDIVEAQPSADDVVLASAPVPEARPEDVAAQPALAAANTLAAPVADDQQVDVIGAWLSDNYSLGAPPAPLGQTRPSAPLVPPVGIGADGEPVDLMTSGGIGAAPEIVVAQAEPPVLAMGRPQTDTQALPNGWIVQIGASPTETGANSLISDATSRIGNLSGFKAFVERFEKNGQVFYRARFGGFEGRDDAADMCSQLKKAKMSCLAMQS